MLKLLYFARLREDLGVAAEEFAVPSGVRTVRQLRGHLQGRGAAWQQALAFGSAVRVAVNQEMAQDDTPVGEGDEVAFFPPVTGG